jgi:soluble cytochrome b562
MIALFKKGGDAAELAKKIRDNFIKEVETDFEDSTYKTNLTKLENALKELQKYKDGDKKSVYEGLGATEKKLFDELISKVDAKVKSMQKKKNEEKNNEDTPSTDTPFFKS